MNANRMLASLLSGSTLCAFAVVVAAQDAAPPKDRAVMQAAFARADANADGKVSKDEASRLPAIASKFDELDANKDGVLSIDEFAKGYAAGS